MAIDSPDTLPQLLAPFGFARFSLDHDGRICALDDEAARFLGFPDTGSALADRGFCATFFPRLRGWAEWSAGLAAAPSTVPERFSQARRDGRIVHFAATGLRDEAGLKVLLRNVTEEDRERLALTERNSELETLRALAMEAVRPGEPEMQLRSMLAQCVAAVAADGGCVYTVRDDEPGLCMVADLGIDPELREKVRILRPGQGFTSRAVQLRTPIFLDDIGSHPELVFPRLRKIGMRNFLCYPLVVQDRVLGCMNLFTLAGHRFTAHDVEFFAVMATQMSLLLDHIIGIEALRERNDELEKFNRVAVDRELRMVELKQRIRELEAQLAPSADPLAGPPDRR